MDAKVEIGQPAFAGSRRSRKKCEQLREAVLITGATGALGGALIARLLAETELDVIALVRDTGEASAAERLRGTLGVQGVPADMFSRAHTVAGDLGHPAWCSDCALRDRLRASVTEVFHLAASTDLTAPRAQLMAANVDATETVVALARDLHANGRLRRLNHFSTAFVAGSLQNRIAMEIYPCTEPAWANAYEESKHVAEGLVHAEIAKGLPAVVFRPSIVVGDAINGATDSFGLFYRTIRRIKRSRIRYLPGSPGDRIQIVPGDFVSAAAFEISRQEDADGQIFHLASDCAPDLETLLRVGGEEMEWARKLRLISIQSLPLELTQRIGAVLPFLTYFHIDLCFDTANTRAALAGTGIDMPQTDAEFLRRLITFARDNGYLGTADAPAGGKEHDDGAIQ